MKIAYVTTHDSTNIGAWSGSTYFMAKAMEAQSTVVHRIGGLSEYSDYWLSAKRYWYGKVVKKNWHKNREPRVLRSYARQVERQLDKISADVILSPGTIPVSFLNTSIPIVFWTDATYAGLIDFYPQWSNLCSASRRNGNRMEQMALSKSRLAIYSSDWAADSARNHYAVDPSIIKVVPFGANLELQPEPRQIETLVSGRAKKRPCKLLFVGVDWQRKGGDVALTLARELNNRGLESQLTVAGCKVPQELPPYVTARGFLPKSSAGRDELHALFSEAHFLVLPTRADCVPVVIAEANAFGVPVVASDVGGISTALVNDSNGHMFPINDFVSPASEFILSQLADAEKYKRLAMSSFHEYTDRLNWDVAGKKVRSLLESVCAHRGR